jgi:hypothetical protein
MLSYTKRTLQVTTNVFELLTFLVKAPYKGGWGVQTFLLSYWVESFINKNAKSLVAHEL